VNLAQAVCNRKHYHETRALALCAAIVRMGQTSELLHVYPCSQCGGWHLTHAPLPGGHSWASYYEEQTRQMARGRKELERVHAAMIGADRHE